MLIGIVLVLLGVLSILAAVKGKSINNKVSWVIGTMLLVIGTIASILDFKGYIDLRNRVFVISAGLVFLGYGLFKVYRKLKCTKEAEGIYVGSSISENYNFINSYSPEFKVKFNNECYQNDTGEAFSKKYLNKNFQKGKKYKVYINPENPYDITYKRSLSLNDMTLLIMGVICIISAIIFI